MEEEERKDEADLGGIETVANECSAEHLNGGICLFVCRWQLPSLLHLVVCPFLFLRPRHEHVHLAHLPRN